MDSALQPIPGLAWYDVPDPASPALDELAQRFGIHPLEIEDCRHRPQRAKADEHDRYVFCVLKHLHAQGAKEDGKLFDDFDVFLGPDFLITVHRQECGAVERVRKRGTEEKIQRLDRLFYFIVDEIVDDYISELDEFADETSTIEADILEEPSPEMLQNIFQLKRRLIEFRRIAGGMREVVNAIMRREHGIVGDDLDVYFRDVYDHLIRTVDLIESYRDLLTGSMDIYLSAVANRTNEVMKVLTVYGTVALPLVIITGFFGMNLPLPWQHSPHGLALAVGVMLLSTAIVLLYFKRKKWF
ncbi:MAG TPA: magnesium/cobalt transporter CorA [Terriglobales bacterium]|nr:magnesium/cobalt transporter CorA [Terriglobales bacterium]